MNISKQIIVPLVAASAAVRDETKLRKLIEAAKQHKIDFEKLYEVILQNYLFAGFPSALIALKILKEFFPEKELAFKQNHLKNDGEIVCRKIYGNQFEKLIKNINDFSPELSEWLIEEGYGKVLSRKELSLKEREKAIVAVLTVLGYKSQLYSHIIGAMRVGVNIIELQEIITSLDNLGKKSYKKFGEKVLADYLKRKGD